MIRIGLALAFTLLAGTWSVTASHAQEPTTTPSVAATATATSATATAVASVVGSPTPFNTPPPGELIAPAPQPTGPSVIAPQTGFGDASKGQTPPWIGLVTIGILGAIVGAAGISARIAVVKARNR
jgi:hypothetical protein